LQHKPAPKPLLKGEPVATVLERGLCNGFAVAVLLCAGGNRVAPNAANPPKPIAGAALRCRGPGGFLFCPLRAAYVSLREPHLL